MSPIAGTQIYVHIFQRVLTSIGNWAFLGCSSLALRELPASLTSIGYRAFEGCSSLSLWVGVLLSSFEWAEVGGFRMARSLPSLFSCACFSASVVWLSYALADSAAPSAFVWFSIALALALALALYVWFLLVKLCSKCV